MLLLTLVAVLGSRSALLAPGPLGDESAYICAAQALIDGRGLVACPRYLYGEGPARAAAALLSWGGLSALLIVLRVMLWLGAAASVWFSLAYAPWSWRVRLLLGAAAVLLWSPVTQALTLGNLSAATTGLTLCALALLERHALAAGALLGFALVLKPLPAAVPLVLASYGAAFAWRARRVSPELVAGLVALAVAGTLVLLGGGLPLPPPFDPRPRNPITLVRAIHQLGLSVSPTLCFVLVSLGGCVLAARMRPQTRLLVALALVTSLLASPLVWNHSFLLAGPLIVMAFVRALERYRHPSAASQERQRALLALAGTLACAIFISASDSFGELAHGSKLGVAALAAPLWAPSVLLAYLWFSEPGSRRGREPQGAGVPRGA
jgi:hypothetical protein